MLTLIGVMSQEMGLLASLTDHLVYEDLLRLHLSSRLLSDLMQSAGVDDEVARRLELQRLPRAAAAAGPWHAAARRVLGRKACRGCLTWFRRPSRLAGTFGHHRLVVCDVCAVQSSRLALVCRQDLQRRWGVRPEVLVRQGLARARVDVKGRHWYFVLDVEVEVARVHARAAQSSLPWVMGRRAPQAKPSQPSQKALINQTNDVA